MSVFVRRAKMTKNCIKCICFDDGRLSCKAENKSLLDDAYYERRPDWCPIIDVLTEDDLSRRWIPVTEKLPDYPGRFLCYYEVDDYGEIGHCIDWGRYDPDDGWYVSGVTHWMPLPEPPEEET